jgi:uncharacterized glyoxalase superfamily protein PhnB
LLRAGPEKALCFRVFIDIACTRRYPVYLFFTIHQAVRRLSMAQAIPEGGNVPIPHYVVKDARAFLDFLGKAFGAETLHIMPGPDGNGVMHAAARIGSGTIMCADFSPEGNYTRSDTMLYFEDVDAVFQKAIEAGSKEIMPVADMFWGDRWCLVEDPFGNRWQLATHKEDVAPEDMPQRMAAQFGG